MQLFHNNNHKNSLLIFFSGWALDFNPFAHLFSDEYDLLFIWDYRNTDFEFNFSKYNNIQAIAFSYGVFMSKFVEIPKIDSFCAINGTPYPISKDFGINPKMFELTLNNLNETALEKFYRNMFSSTEQYETFRSHSNKNINIQSLKEELENIKKLAQIDTITNQIFSKTFISTNDRIIPTKSQQNYWNNRTNIQYLNCGHFPFYKYKMDDLL